MLPLLAILALGALIVNANPVDVESDVGLTEECQSYSWNFRRYKRCRGETKGDDFKVDNVYQAAIETCRNKDKTMTCIADAVKDCRNFRDIRRITEASFGFCDKGKVSPVMNDFLANNAGKSLTETCLDTMLQEIFNKSGLPSDLEPDPTNLAENMSAMKSYVIWYIDQFLSMDQSETTAACDGMTRQTVYGIMIATVDVAYGWGFDLYPEFANMVETRFKPWAE